MKKEHYIQALEHNGISILQHQEGERAGVIKHSEFISTTYYENEEVIQSFQIFWAGVASADPAIQLKHSIEVLKIVDKTVELIAGIKGAEVLSSLGLFKQPLALPKQNAANGFHFRIESVQGLLSLAVAEENQTIENRPPINS